jgi:hypothetical protein
MLTKEATIQIVVDHLRASATDEVRTRFSVGDEEEFAYELGVHIGSVMAKLFVDDADELNECVDGMMAYIGTCSRLDSEE